MTLEELEAQLDKAKTVFSWCCVDYNKFQKDRDEVVELRKLDEARKNYQDAKDALEKIKVTP